MEKLARVILSQVAKKAAGSLADVDIPGWETSEASVEWVRASRMGDNARLEDVREE